MQKPMKWPVELVLIRHDVSAYNVLRDKKAKNPLYRAFLKAWEKNPESAETRRLARAVQKKFALNIGDANTPLADTTGRRPLEVGMKLAEMWMGGEIGMPDAIFVSPYLRTMETLRHLVRGFEELKDVPVVSEDRIREQEHGLSLLYNDWRVFHALHPDQRHMRAAEGPYFYRYPQGESVLDVRDRNRSMLTTLTRDFAGKRVWMVTHHLNILATRANLERWSPEHFIEADEHNKPVNCGVSIYHGNSQVGSNGRLELKRYNQVYYTP